MWWNSMSALQQTAFIIACAASFVLVLQLIMLLIGGSTDAEVGGGLTDAQLPSGDISDVDISDTGALDGGGFDVDASTDGDISDGVQPGGGRAFGLRLLSLRSIIAFFAVGGWMCYTMCYMLDWYWAVVIAVASGFAAACAMAAALLGMEKMQGDGNIDPNNAIGKTGTVYLTVPPERTGKGKVNILIQERYAEYDAITNGSTALPTASEIKVVGYDGANVLIVEKYKKPSITIETE